MWSKLRSRSASSRLCDPAHGALQYPLGVSRIPPAGNPPHRQETRAMTTQTPTQTAADVQEHLQLLLVERALASHEGLAGNAAYMADLEDEIQATRDAYVGAA